MVLEAIICREGGSTRSNFSKKFNHGEAISIGMITEAKISNHLGLLSSKDLEKIIIHFKKCKLKTYDKILKDKKLLKILAKDKKNFQNNINFSLVDKIGSSIFYKKLDKNQVFEILKNI